MIPKKIEKKKKEKINNGFTLIETMISLLLIALAMVTLARMTAFTATGQQRSAIWTTLLQEIENRRNMLLAQPFSSTGLRDGRYHDLVKGIRLDWTIESLSASLKKISLSAAAAATKQKVINKKIYFYKSKFINGW